MHRSVCSQFWRMDRRSFSSFSSLSAPSPGQPIQMPPFFCNRGFMAVASPPELRSVAQPRSVFRNVRGRRFETTIKRLRMCSRASTLAVLEELDLSETLLRLCLRLVLPTQVFFALLGHHFVAAFHFYYHVRTPIPIFSKAATKSMDESL